MRAERAEEVSERAARVGTDGSDSWDVTAPGVGSGATVTTVDGWRPRPGRGV
ncbi:hypothetical protein GJR88_02046 [Dietzia sp. DQ12-45-1b]|nr:hypothetical protein GJR88_02046 [Dietzia sp. DQ12-45-1b]